MVAAERFVNCLKTIYRFRYGPSPPIRGSAIRSDHPTAADRKALSAQPACLLFPAVRDQLAARPDHAPPGKTGGPGQNIANSAGRTGVAGSACNFAIADDLATPEVPQNALHGLGERRFLRHDVDSGYRRRS